MSKPGLSLAAFLVLSTICTLSSARLSGATLQIVNSGARQTEDGALAHDSAFVPGETVYYSFQATGYAATPGAPETRKVKLDYEIEVLDPQGVPLIEKIQSVMDTVLSDEDKEWKPKVRSEFLLPHFAPPGKYVVKVSLTDAIGRTTAKTESTFTVSGRTVEPSQELAVRNFGFYRSEEEAAPLRTAAYRAGDSIFARFDIAGFRYGPRNTVEVSYDVAVQNPDGKVIYSQLNAAVEKSFSYYPKPYVPGGMNLSLQENMRKGEYAVVLTVHDVVGKQNFELRQTFQVE